jgi:hypothetical protein
MDAGVEILLAKWAETKARLAKMSADIKPIVEEERKLRDLVMMTLWPDKTLKEGTNYYDLPHGWRIKGVHKLDRKIDRAPLPAVKIQLREMGVNPDVLIEDIPELCLKPYRQLTEEQRVVFDQVLIIKPSAPTLELVPPKT